MYRINDDDDELLFRIFADQRRLSPEDPAGALLLRSNSAIVLNAFLQPAC
jgi:hypothetical protein